MSEKIKVSELNESLTTNDDDLIMIVQENSNNELENFKQTRAKFLEGLDLTDYVKNTDYATNSEAGVIKGNVYGFAVSGAGVPSASKYTYEQYTGALGDNHFIGKGTLENVLNARIGDINSLLDEINGEVI